jgi:hypothetical protein
MYEGTNSYFIINHPMSTCLRQMDCKRHIFENIIKVLEDP